MSPSWRSENSLIGRCMLKALAVHGELFMVDFINLCPGVYTHGLHITNLARRGLVTSESVRTERGWSRKVWRLASEQRGTGGDARHLRRQRRVDV